MNNQSNIVLAMMLSIILLFGWDFARRTYFPEPEPLPVDMATRDGAPQSRAKLDSAGGDHPAIGRDLRTDIARSDRIAIDAPEVRGSINPIGARIDDIELKTHRRTVDKQSGPIRLFAPANTAGEQFAQFGWAGEAVDLPGSDTVWRVVDGKRLTQMAPVTLGWENSDGLRFRLRFAIDEHYMLTVTQTITNTGDDAVTLTPYAYISRTSMSASLDSFSVHSGPIFDDGDVEFGWDYDDVAKAGAVANRKTNWVGFTDIYWMSALIPDARTPATSDLRALGGEHFRADLLYKAVTVDPDATVTRTTRLFAGAKESALLDHYEEEGVERFGRAIDWGWFRFLAWPIWQVLIFLSGLVGNFGVAIICLTFVIRLLLFPIAQKGFASMAQMRAAQPKMKALKDRHKDDKAALQTEMAKFYKDEKINPIGGCLPMLLQAPIFFALYKVLLLAIEMRHEPFVLWVKDLSAPDPAMMVNFFGLLPFDPPSFLAFGIMSSLVGFTLWLQFKLNPQTTDPVQQKIFALMPWLMVFVTANVATGLLLYWVTSNTLTLAQMKYLHLRYPQFATQQSGGKQDYSSASGGADQNMKP